MDQTGSNHGLLPPPPNHSAAKNQRNLDTFWKIAAKFNHRLNSIPLLYGSLGLSEALGIPLQTTDIDMLVESDIFTERRSDLHGALQALGFHLVDPMETEFQRDGTRVGVASDGDLMSFAGIDPTRMNIIGDKAKARVLNLNQYLAVYQASLKDGYRKHIREKNDARKIEMIKDRLTERMNLSNKKANPV